MPDASAAPNLQVVKIKQAVLDTMRVLNIDPLSILPFDQTPTFEPFLLECIEEAYKRGYLSRTSPQQPFQEKHVRIGAAVGHYTYIHHRGTGSHAIAVLSSLLMAFYYCVDDYCFDPRSVAEYGSRLAGGRPQLEQGLDDLAALSSELSDMYDLVTGDLIRMSTQAYVMGNHLERQMCGKRSVWDVSKDAPVFPTIMKTITSAATTLFLLSFPHDALAINYLQTLPDGIMVHDTTADIMSYYKEAIEGEFNRVEQIAQLNGVSGPDMLGELVKSMTASHERIVRVLSESDPTGLLKSCYEKTVIGFIVFQALHPRYKIRDFGIFSF
ncbi:hypothetical protein B0H10DRAFT_1948684 [Mycena sp. CBHHK59/15]|nr:hypothetical protein B0H10DRAFT_1948684 [Mycena sp. CBHHK59/15]